MSTTIRLFHIGILFFACVFFPQCANFAYASVAHIHINNQKEFDSISSKINNAVAAGADYVKVNIDRDIYYFRENHIALFNRNYENVVIEIKGNNSRVISAGVDLKTNSGGKSYKKGSAYIDAEYNDIHNFSNVYQAEGLVEVVDNKNKLCRIYCSDIIGLEIKNYENLSICLTSWYTSYVYPISQISSGYVYFVADNLQEGIKPYGNYNVNYDFTVGKILPRFRFVNVPVNGCDISVNGTFFSKHVDSDVHQCENSTLFHIANTQLKRLYISGLVVCGNNSKAPLFLFNNLKCDEIIISDSEFSSMKSVVIYGSATDNISIINNNFHDNYSHVVFIDNQSSHSVVSNNCFSFNGKSLTNTFCIVCQGEDYLISYNTIKDFGYTAIAVGLPYFKYDADCLPYGIVEFNHVFYTVKFLEEKRNWTLIDSGAIYLWTLNDGSIIRNNFIHNYGGMGSNRGIYCDDGTRGCSVFDNIVLDIENSYCIDLRRSSALDLLGVELVANVNNYMSNNIINGSFRFEGRKDDFTSVKSRNFILTDNSLPQPKVIIKDVVEKRADVSKKYRKKKVYRKANKMVAK